MMRSLEAQRNPDDPERVHQAYSATMPTGRYTLPEEVAGVVLYLSSEISGNVTGTHIVIDGGRSGSGGSSLAAQEAAAGLTPQLAAEGYTVVNGQIVRKLGVGGPNLYERADALVSATDAVGHPQFAEYAGWALLVLGLILVPPLIAMRINRRRQAAVAVTEPPTGN